MEKRFQFFAQLTLIFLLVVGCFWVLKPFLAAILLAGVVCISTWPLYVALLHRLKDKPNIAALTMTISLTVVIIFPLALVAYTLAENVTTFYEGIKGAVETGQLNPPSWLKKLPIIGESVDSYWHLVTSSREEMVALAKRFLEPIKNFLLAGGMVLGQGVLQMSLAAFVCFFFYRDGMALVNFIRVRVVRVLGVQTSTVFTVIQSTVRSIMFGLLGTALAQGIVATTGFVIAGVPAAVLLGAATCLFSLIPIGPPIIWGGAAIWLFSQGMTGWGVFMLIWGFFLISGVDNVVKPLLISRGSNLPFILVLFGVLGGVAAFGFVGAFIGPTLLAVGLNLIQLRPNSSEIETSEIETGVIETNAIK